MSAQPPAAEAQISKPEQRNPLEIKADRVSGPGESGAKRERSSWPPDCLIREPQSKPGTHQSKETRRLGSILATQELSHISQRVGDITHYRLAPERPFLAQHRAHTTILFGTLSTYHDTLVQAVFRGAGYLCEKLPTPRKAAHETGKEFCNNGLCNPNYYTAGNLIEYLRALEAKGHSREYLVDHYIYYTAGGCGPCRYGMYESEYRQALDNAGYHGFRIVTFDSNQVIAKGSEQPGLRYTIDFGLGMLNALFLGDVLFELGYQIRPYEVHAGDTDRALAESLTEVATFLETRPHRELLSEAPWWLADLVKDMPRTRFWAPVLAKIFIHLYADDFVAMLARVRERLDAVEVDRLRVKPAVKVTGEFFSAIAEGDANYGMFRFLEQEGAEVSLDSISSLVMYWLNQARTNNRRKRGIVISEGEYRKKELLFAFSDWFWTRHYHRTIDLLGGTAHRLIPQKTLVALAAPYYDPFARGGEGHLEVAKTIYYSQHRYCHMVVSLKPFGCMPSTQSDGVMAGVIAHHPEVLFLAVETSGEGEANAHSRVQMALGDARRRARAEFDAALASTGRSLEEIREYMAANRDLRRPFYKFPRREGIAGTAAQMVLHIAGQLSGDRRAAESPGKRLPQVGQGLATVSQGPDFGPRGHSGLSRSADQQGRECGNSSAAEPTQERRS
jgi:predicted nucleotide-binding protein (sugar kinase/HSP70/actin superfamily)